MKNSRKDRNQDKHKSFFPYVVVSRDNWWCKGNTVAMYSKFIQNKEFMTEQ